MIRIEAIKDYIATNSKIPKKDMSIHTTNHTTISTRNKANGVIEVDRTYDATIYILDAHKWRDFTTVQLLLGDWKREKSHEGETFEASTDDSVDDNTALMTIDFDIREEINLIPITEDDTVEFHRITPYRGVDYRMEERTRLTGI